MKKALKLLLWTVVLVVILTLSQAATFGGILEIEREFFADVFNNPFAWFGYVILWKYVALALVIISVFVVAVISFIRLLVHKNRAPKTCVHEVPRTTERIGVVHSNEASTSNTGKFTRINKK